MEEITSQNECFCGRQIFEFLICGLVQLCALSENAVRQSLAHNYIENMPLSMSMYCHELSNFPEVLQYSLLFTQLIKSMKTLIFISHMAATYEGTRGNEEKSTIE